MFLDQLEALGASQETIALAHGILLGDKSQFSTEMIQNFRMAGMSHLLAVSGLHVGIIMSIIFVIFKPIEWLVLSLTTIPALNCRIGSPTVTYILGNVTRFSVILFTSLYVFWIGAPPSAVRATLMLSLCLVGWMFRRPASTERCLLFAALLLLAWDPWNITQVGFQLSFLSVGGILLFRPWLTDHHLPWVWRVILLSVAAQSLTIPIVAYYFHQIPFIGWLQGLLVVPLLPVFVTLLLLVFCSPLFSWLIVLVEGMSSWMGYVAEMIGNIETYLIGGHLYFYPTWYEALMAEIGVLAFILVLRMRVPSSKTDC